MNNIFFPSAGGGVVVGRIIQRDRQPLNNFFLTNFLTKKVIFDKTTDDKQFVPAPG